MFYIPRLRIMAQQFQLIHLGTRVKKINETKKMGGALSKDPDWLKILTMS
jgi:hypothetical protein